MNDVKPLPEPTDIVLVSPNGDGPATAVMRMMWDGIEGRYKMWPHVLVADAREIKFATKGSRLSAAMVPMESNGTVDPDACRAALRQVKSS